MTEGLLDTSVFIAVENERLEDFPTLPDESFVSVITLAELEAGVLTAPTVDIRSRRLRTLQALASIDVLPITADAAHEWARLRTALAGSGRRININDLWIAATALANGLPVYTQDADFDVLADIGGPQIFRV